MQKNKNENLKNLIMLCASAVLLALSVMLHTKQSGIFSTLPLIFFVPPLVSLFYNNRKNILLIVLVSSVAVSYIYTNDVGYCAFFTICMCAYAYLGLLAKRLLVTFLKRGVKSCAVFFVLCIVFALGTHLFLFGTPISCIISHNNTVSYLKNTYAQEFAKFRMGNTHYDMESGKYLTEFEFTDEYWITAYASANGEEITDGYKNYAEYLFLNLHKENIENEAEKLNDIAVRGTNISNFAQKTVLLSEGYDEYISQMNFELAFYDDFEDETAFSSACEEIFKRLQKRNILFESITFYAGINGEFLYQCTAKNNELGSTVPFDAQSYNFLKSELDIQHFWRYPLG